MWIAYQTANPFPQPIIIGRGVTHVDGSWTAPPGMDGANVDDAEFIHGFDERFYDWTDATTMTPKSQAEVDAIRAQDQAEATAKQQEQANARAELDTGPPPQSVPGLAARVQAIEIILGLKTYT